MNKPNLYKKQEFIINPVYTIGFIFIFFLAFLQCRQVGEF